MPVKVQVESELFLQKIKGDWVTDQFQFRNPPNKANFKLTIPVILELIRQATVTDAPKLAQ